MEFVLILSVFKFVRILSVASLNIRREVQTKKDSSK